MGHFQILPTDQRMKELTRDQMELLYIGYLTSPSDEELRNAYRNSKKEIESNEALEEMGYNSEEMEEINKAIADLG